MDFKKQETAVEPIDRWFMREVYVWRKGGSIFWYITCLPILTMVYLLAANINIFHPIQTLIDVFMTIFSLSMVIRLVFILIINGALIWYSSAFFTVTPEIGETRFSNLLRLMKVSRLCHLGVYCMSSVILAWCCSCFIGGKYSSLTQSPDGLVVNLNEPHLFLILYGLFLGISFFSQFYLDLNNYLEFPLIQRDKFFQVRSITGCLLICCIKNTLKQVKYFYLLYYLFGSVPRSWVMYNLNLQFSVDDVPLDSIYGLFNCGLLWEVVIFGVYINYTWSLANILFKIYQTEHYSFPVEDVFDSQYQRCLYDALNCNIQPLIKYLGYLDLYSLAKFSAERRKRIFCLSQPGGHPHTWNRISSVCLAEINDLCGQIEAANWKTYASVPIKQANVIDRSYTQGEGMNDSQYYHSTTLHSVNYNNNFNNITLNNTNPVSENNVEPAPKKTFTIWREKFSALVSKKPGIGYFMGELPDSKSRVLFASSQIQIWAVEALSDLVTASFEEDKFGIVQRSLPTILSSLLNLQENVEKHFKLVTPVTRRNNKDIFTVNDATLRYQLQSVLKSSIYRIINKFGKHIRDLPMDPDCSKKLRPFLEYKE
ncbi:hypothetical protein SNE40_004715 [Patella caerulea]|uniref:Nucleoporin NDC1 n=1 Tax=Patella caerulea TaxID=87958 RepID=A0AAN8Q1A6_PATCE